MSTQNKMPSELFEEAFRSGIGSTHMTCDCGREYFDSVHGDYEGGELEKLQELAKTNPEKYIDQDCGARSIEILGRHFVMGCPCTAKLSPYEDFIWSNRNQIVEYIGNRVREIKKDISLVSESLSLLKEEK